MTVLDLRNLELSEFNCVYLSRGDWEKVLENGDENVTLSMFGPRDARLTVGDVITLVYPSAESIGADNEIPIETKCAVIAVDCNNFGSSSHIEYVVTLSLTVSLESISPDIENVISESLTTDILEIVDYVIKARKGRASEEGIRQHVYGEVHQFVGKLFSTLPQELKETFQGYLGVSRDESEEIERLKGREKELVETLRIVKDIAKESRYLCQYADRKIVELEPPALLSDFELHCTRILSVVRSAIGSDGISVQIDSLHTDVWKLLVSREIDIVPVSDLDYKVGDLLVLDEFTVVSGKSVKTGKTSDLLRVLGYASTENAPPLLKVEFIEKGAFL